MFRVSEFRAKGVKFQVHSRFGGLGCRVEALGDECPADEIGMQDGNDMCKDRP